MRVLGLLILAVAIPAGCQEGQPVESDLTGERYLENSDQWPFRPEAMRIHPLTRFRAKEDDAAPTLEIRLEFLDPWGDTTKAVGVLHILLLDENQPIASIDSRNLNDLAVNEALYDPITRTYRLEIEKLQLDAALIREIHARLMTPSGTVLEAEYEITP